MIRNLLMIALIALTFSACATSAGQNVTRAAAADAAKFDAAQLSTAVTEKEKAVWEAFKNKQFEQAQTVWAEDYSGVYDEGIHTKSQEFEGIRTLDLKSYSFSDIKTAIPNRETAVITYKVTMKASYQGHDISGVYNAATVWRERNGDWQAILHTDIKAQ